MRFCTTSTIGHSSIGTVAVACNVNHLLMSSGSLRHSASAASSNVNLVGDALLTIIRKASNRSVRFLLVSKICLALKSDLAFPPAKSNSKQKALIARLPASEAVGE